MPNTDIINKNIFLISLLNLIGLYNSVSEDIREALRLLISQEGISQEQINMLNKDIEEGLNDTLSLDGHSAMKKLISKYE